MLSYYTPEKIRRIKEAQNYQDLLKVGQEVLYQICKDSPLKPIAMLCGPISTGGTGIRADNLKIFARAIDRICADGLLVFNQMPFEDDMERLYKSQGPGLLEAFYLPLFESRLVKLLCFLPGWEQSTGARWENAQARRLKIPIIYLSDYYTINDKLKSYQKDEIDWCIICDKPDPHGLHRNDPRNCNPPSWEERFFKEHNRHPGDL